MPGDFAILIVESQVGPFVSALQNALDHIGAQSLVVRDAEAALERCEQYEFAGALLNANHALLLDDLAARDIPALVYKRSESPTAITSALKALLAID